MFKKSKIKLIVSQRHLNRRISDAIQDEIRTSQNVGITANQTICSSLNYTDSDASSQHDLENTSETEKTLVLRPSTSSTLSIPEKLEENTLKEKLKIWAITEKVTHSAVTSLLHILQPYNLDLPLDSRSLLKTPRHVNIKMMDNGEYIHFNLKNTLKLIIENYSDKFSNQISLSFNIDGLPIFNSSTLQFWPILCLLKHDYFSPFTVGIFCGTSKPKNLDLFLEDFIKDLSDLLENGIFHNNKKYIIRIHSFVCDAPARAFIKCIKSHGGYSSCERCTEFGTYVNKRVIFNNSNAAKRTDESFYLQTDDNHHIGVSPLIKLHIGLVTKFPIDYMHAVCLGVMKKLLNSWLGGDLNIRFPARVVEGMSEHLLFVRKFVPSEINRKPRELSQLPRWKATELRTFLLYLGPVILKNNNIEIGIYQHFLLLHCSIFILVSPQLVHQSRNVEMAKKMLDTFVSHCKEIYGLDYLIYNIHNLIHLSDDVKNYGPLDTISAFPFENFLGQIKNLIKTPHKPLHQVYNRIVESNHFMNLYKPPQHTKFMYEHTSGPILDGAKYSQFKKLVLSNFELSIYSHSVSDCYCLLFEGSIIEIHNILYIDKNRCILIGKEFLKKTSVYDYPISSALLGIYCLSDLSNMKQWEIEIFPSKCFVFPTHSDTSWISFPLLHTCSF